MRIFLNNAGASLPAPGVVDAMTHYLQLEVEWGGYEAFDVHQAEVQGFYHSVARLLNAQTRNIAWAVSATDAYARALSAIPWQEGDVILTTENDYSSNQIAFLSLQQKRGIQLVRAADLPSGGVDPDSFEQLLKKHRPKLAAVTHVPTNSGLVQPVALLGRMCREQGVWYLVDACQSAGQMPLDVQEIGCDFLTATMRKYLRGPRGAGFLFASDRVLEAGLELLLPDMRAADWIGANEYRTQATARRFEYWEIACALMMGSKVAVDYALQTGLEHIQAQVNQLADFTRHRLAELPDVQVLDRGAVLCGIVTAHAPHWEPQELMRRLYAQGINARISPRVAAQIDFGRKGVEWALRISPHYFNTEAEVEQLLAIVGE